LPALSVPATAAADKFAETLEISVGVQGGWITADTEVEIVTGPAEAAHTRLIGEGAMWQLPARGGFTLDGLRFGLGAGPWWTQHLRLRGYPEPVLDGIHGGAAFEAYVGYAFGAPDEVRPFIEARPWLAMGRIDVAPGDAELRALVYGLDAHAGVRIPIGVWAFVEAGATAGIIGPNRAAARLSLGIPIPMAHL
jgi:hypothetical protein